MNDTERVKEVIDMLNILIEQIRPMGKHCKIEMVTSDSADFVLRNAVECMEYLNNIRWDEIQ